MRVTVAETTGGYAGGVSAFLRDPGGPVPVLHPPGSLLPHPAADGQAPPEEDSSWASAAAEGAVGVTRWLGGRPLGDDGAVVGFGDPDWALPAALHAAGTGRALHWFDTPEELVTAVGKLVATTGTAPLTICARPDLITRQLQDAVLDLLSFDAPMGPSPERPVSFLTARTLPIVTRVVAAHLRTRAGRVSRAVGLFADRMIGTVDDDVLTCLDGEALTADAVRALGRPDLLMMWGHTREDLFHLGRDALCGRSLEWAGADPGAHRPACAVDGRCVKDGDVLPLTAVGADAVFIGGCHVLRMGLPATFAPEFSLAFSAQEAGAAVVVSSPWAVVGSPAEFLLLYRLLRGGVPVGEAVRLLNAALPYLGPDSPSYLVLGEGDTVLFDAPPPAGELTRTAVDGGVRITGRGLDAEFVTVALDSLSSAPTVRSSGRDLQYAVVPEPGGGATVVLFDQARITGELDVTVDFTPPGRDAGRAVTAALANLDAYGRLLRGYRPKLKSWEQEWRSTATYLARNEARARYDTQAAAATDRRAAETAAAIGRADRELCAHYLTRTASNKPFSVHEQCLTDDGTFTVVAHATADACAYCGDTVMARTLASALAPATRRVLGICRTCGTVWDRPIHLDPPVVRMDPLVRRSVEHPVDLLLSNPLDRSLHGWAGLALRNSHRHGTRVWPETAEVELGPGEQRAFRFLLTAGESSPTYADFLRAFWTAELGVAAALRLVWVGAGHPSAPDGTASEAPPASAILPHHGR
ncbi:hypothetical protein [Kitasatospora sp. MAP5-34]|uniref:hypothetical protein n=1 Tax=Kitasatospora sp. MAP5-34 TaxID=3035102 RepID=UPI0024735501|nr:hypothetical protein [Kitasatospora sp. MAP5-34]MDH6574583.1 hypothetical protein [Kitasatospora sp. MAP5-34]